jgi:hypothetical protein
VKQKPLERRGSRDKGRFYNINYVSVLDKCASPFLNLLWENSLFLVLCVYADEGHLFFLD